MNETSIHLRTREAFRHLPGFGPRKVAALRAAGIHSWTALLHHHHLDLPGLDSEVPAWVSTVRAHENALAAGRLAELVHAFHRSDHWRLLADFLDRATFLDIETSGDQVRPDITLIITRHRGSLQIFTAEHNLDDVLELLDDIDLLVTFNGASFDVPQMENHFHIPLRDVAHIDLRWVCYHAGLRGGLKEIERAIGLVRPPDLIGVDGAEADWLWRRWKQTGNRKLLDRLTRYCAADVIGLLQLSHWLVAHHTGKPEPLFDWTGLPEATDNMPAGPPAVRATTSATPLEQRLRARLRAARSG